MAGEEQGERLERERFESRKLRRAPAHIDHPGPSMDSECRVLQQKIDARRRELRETLESLDGDLAIINTLRNSGGVQGKARSGLYAFIEKVLGPDDRDGQILVEYLRSNMRVADMPSRTGLTVQPIRSRVAHGFDKLVARLDAVHAVEDYDLLPLFRSLVSHAVAADPAPVKRRGPKGKPSIEKDLAQALQAIDHLVAENRALKDRVAAQDATRPVVQDKPRLVVLDKTRPVLCTPPHVFEHGSVRVLARFPARSRAPARLRAGFRLISRPTACSKLHHTSLSTARCGFCLVFPRGHVLDRKSTRLNSSH